MNWLNGFWLALFATSALAQGRMFSDDFQGTLNPQWQAPYYNPCVIVGAAVDGVAPHFGTQQLECNWNATVSWDNAASHSTLQIPASAYPYTREFFVRFWARYSQDVTTVPAQPGITPVSGGAIFDIDTFNWQDPAVQPWTANTLWISAILKNSTDSYSYNQLGVLWTTEGVTGSGCPGCEGPDFYGQWWYYDDHIWVDNVDTGPWQNWCNAAQFPVCASALRPNPSDRAWHEYEIYLKTNTPGNQDGFARMWFDKVRIIDVENDMTVNPPSGNFSRVWAPIEIMSNGPVLGANNHVYFANFEVYTDQGTGATGSMSDATIAQPPVCH